MRTFTLHAGLHVFLTTPHTDPGEQLPHSKALALERAAQHTLGGEPLPCGQAFFVQRKPQREQQRSSAGGWQRCLPFPTWGLGRCQVRSRAVFSAQRAAGSRHLGQRLALLPQRRRGTHSSRLGREQAWIHAPRALWTGGAGTWAEAARERAQRPLGRRRTRRRANPLPVGPARAVLLAAPAPHSHLVCGGCQTLLM